MKVLLTMALVVVLIACCPIRALISVMQSEDLILGFEREGDDILAQAFIIQTLKA